MVKWMQSKSENYTTKIVEDYFKMKNVILCQLTAVPFLLTALKICVRLSAKFITLYTEHFYTNCFGGQGLLKIKYAMRIDSICVLIDCFITSRLIGLWCH